MSRRLPAVIVILLAAGVVPAHAQRDMALALAVVPTLAHVDGVVRDEAGRVVPGAVVIAVGGLMATVRSGADGRYTLALSPGRYVLRASREGYVSSYREAVEVDTLDRLKRDITLVRQPGEGPGVGQTDEPMTPLVPADESAETDGHSHSDTAWRLRHLRRSVLRDGQEHDYASTSSTMSADRADAWFDRAVATSARAAATFFTNTAFDGQVHLLTTTDLGSAAGGRPPAALSRGVAYAVVRADAGSHGIWAVRGAVTATSEPSWVIVGEYATPATGAHAARAGMSFGVQSDSLASQRGRPASASDSRHAGAVFAADRWQVASRVLVDYGLRLERFGYLPDQSLASPHLAVEGRVLPRTAAVAAVSRRAAAPGADEFLPPSADGPWLPPDRTFSPLLRDGRFEAERVRRTELGIDHRFGREDHQRTLSIRRFEEVIADQTVVLFGLGRRDRVPGHYRVADLDHGHVEGWTVRLAGPLLPGFEGSLEYAMADAAWAPGQQVRLLRWLTPSAARSGEERLHDLTTQVAAEFESSDTRLLLVHRVSTGFSHARQVDRDSGLGQRFAIEVRQGLPYRPFVGGRLDVVVSIRNLFRDPGQVASLYDELLTVSPPLRVTGGVRVNF